MDEHLLRKMKTYKITFELEVDKCWVDDGLTAKTLARRIKEELPSDLVSVATSSEIVVKKIKVSVKK